MSETEIKVYGVHISQKNSMKTLMSKDFMMLTESCGAVLMQNGKDPVRYLASFILPTKEKQSAFAAELKKRKIKADADKSPPTWRRRTLKNMSGASGRRQGKFMQRVNIVPEKSYRQYTNFHLFRI